MQDNELSGGPTPRSWDEQDLHTMICEDIEQGEFEMGYLNETPIFIIDRKRRVYHFKIDHGTVIVHRATFLGAVRTYQEEYHMSYRNAVHRAIKVTFWCCINYKMRGEQVLTSYYV